jgi:hypothetical protein
MIDRDWPHQVAVPSPVVVDRFEEIHAAASRLGACLRTHAFRRDDVDHVVYCFARADQAKTFQAQFGGEPMRPEERPKWAHAADG